MQVDGQIHAPAALTPCREIYVPTDAGRAAVSGIFGADLGLVASDIMRSVD